MKNQKNMPKEINKIEIFEKLKNKLSKYSENLKVTADTNGKFELYGNKKVTLANKERWALFCISYHYEKSCRILFLPKLYPP
jgi:hypothetical protein